MKRQVLAAALALVALDAGAAAAADCKGRMEAVAKDYSDFFSSRDTTFLNNQPVLRDLRNAAIRLQAQGLDEACGNVVAAMQQAIEAYRAEGDKPDAEKEALIEPQKIEQPASVGEADASHDADLKASQAAPEQVDSAIAPADPAGTQAPVPEKLVDVDRARADAARADLEARAVWFTDSDVLRDTAEVSGAEVLTFDSERLGDAEGLLLGNGRPTHLVVDRGGFWNLGKKRIAIPIGIVRWDPKRETFLVPLSEEQLQDAPKYDGKDGNWGAQANDGFYAALID